LLPADHKLRTRETAFETAFAQLGDDVEDLSLLFGLKRFQRRGCIQIFLGSIHGASTGTIRRAPEISRGLSEVKGCWNTGEREGKLGAYIA